MRVKDQYFPYRNPSNIIPQQKYQHDDQYVPYDSQLDDDPPLQTAFMIFPPSNISKNIVVEDVSMPTLRSISNDRYSPWFNFTQNLSFSRNKQDLPQLNKLST
uniref:Uncharacterized protein n=1 Tax=Glossina pallidipes TaxID=7398 RepID=A0A1A9ZGG7_GLOPL